MSYSLEKIESIIKASVDSLKENQPMLFKQDDNISERTVSSALHVFLIPYFPKHHVNCEYNKMTDEHGNQIPKRINRNPNDAEPSKVYPDIIVHRQENRENNLLIAELKMSWKNQGKEDDYGKLEKYKLELGYKFSLYLELGEKGIVEITWF
jgi:hypothetical protein